MTADPGPQEPGPQEPGRPGRSRPDSRSPERRELAPDVTRSLALAGVIVMNYHGYMILRGANRRDGAVSELFDPWQGVFSGRFAATFVLVAGIGVTLMTRSAVGDPARMRTLRWRLASRGVVLYTFGLGLDLIWRGSILPFYGAMFAVAALLVTMPSRWVLSIGASAAVAGAALEWWILERQLGGHDTGWLTNPPSDSVRGVVFDLAVNGTHPLLPWLAFFCVGIAIGRWLTHDAVGRLVAAIGCGALALAVIGRTLAYDPPWSDQPITVRTAVLFSTDPVDGGLLFTLSALGSSMIAFAAIHELVARLGRRPVIDGLARAGQLSLTIYVVHVLVFNLLVDVWAWIPPDGAPTAVGFAVLVWSVSTLAAVGWQIRWRRGPVEQVYRSITR